MGHRGEWECELAVIGAGVAGMAASLFASNRGISVAQVGGSGGILFASGLLDLLAVHPIEEGNVWFDPWEGIEALREDIPEHPLSRIPDAKIRASLAEYLAFMESAGIPYAGLGEKNVEMITPAGTCKQTYRLPLTMWKAVTALREKRPCVIVDFHGLREFNANLIVDTIGEKWPLVRSERLWFPGTEGTGRVFSRHMALSLEKSECLETLAARLKPLIRQGEALGMPALLGLQGSPHLLARLEEIVGAPVFEIPTLPASVPGFRLKEAFERHLPAKGVKVFFQSKVAGVSSGPDGRFRLRFQEDGDTTGPAAIVAKGVVLATGRFFGKGLSSDRTRVWETIFGLPVWQPPHRGGWHRRDLLDPSGHEINQAGIEVDEAFRPLDARHRPAFERLFAAGSILAHQDWMRMKCGSGVAIASAYAAVEAFCEMRT